MERPELESSAVYSVLKKVATPLTELNEISTRSIRSEAIYIYYNSQKARGLHVFRFINPHPIQASSGGLTILNTYLGVWPSQRSGVDFTKSLRLIVSVIVSVISKLFIG